MLQVCAAILTSAAVLLHAVLGCCWHHSHGEQETAAHASEPRATCHHHATHERSGSAHEHEGGTGEQECPESPCSEPPCDFLGRPAGDAGFALDFGMSQPAVVAIATDLRQATTIGIAAGTGEHSQSLSAREHCALLNVWRL